MPRKKSKSVKIPKTHGKINGAGSVLEEKIIDTLEKNYMPYAMSVILSRAIPEIDGFKPSHRKLLYTMYKMGLLGQTRTKSANIVGQTMKLNPHGDSAIYDTMVRLSKGYEALLHPYIDSKGNFGKFYSRDMAWAASRYTEAKLDSIAKELFDDIDKDTIDFVDNYDNTMKEPTLLPVRFPSVLVNANTGIAVGMASSICSFNLKEVCDTTIELMQDPNFDITTTLIAPDFTGGGQIIYDKDAIDQIYKTGKGSIKVRGKYTYDKNNHCIDITSIPPTTSSEAIIEKVIDLVKNNKLKEISDIRDETGIDGLKITIDLKRNIDPDKLMQKLYKITPLEDSFSCNFNIIISGVPKVMGIKEILEEWIAFRVECVRRRTKFELDKKSNKLHLLKGLRTILLDIDKAITIIRKTEEESEVIPNLMVGFGIDEVQAEYVSEIKLRHLNKEYILKRTDEISSLEEDINRLTKIFENRSMVKTIIASELRDIASTYGQPRQSMLIYRDQISDYDEIEEIPSYPVNLFLTKEGYFKKITDQSLRMSGEQKIKDDDQLIQSTTSENDYDILFFTNLHQVYKAKISSFTDTKASVLGEYLPTKLALQENEKILYMAPTKKYEGYMIFFFDNGRIAKVEMKSYETKTNRKKLIGAYCDKHDLLCMEYIKKNEEFLMESNSGRKLLIHTGLVPAKTTKNTQGLVVMTQLKGKKLISVQFLNDSTQENFDYYRTSKLPSSGKIAPKIKSSISQPPEQLHFF